MDGERYFALHGNYGVLFAEAEISGEDTIVPQYVENPRILILATGNYGILADRAGEEGHALLWRTVDFKEFQPALLMEKSGEQWEALWAQAKDVPQESHIVEGEAVMGSSMEISRSFCDRIV